MPPVLGAIGASLGIGTTTGAVAATATTAAVAATASTAAVVAGTIVTAATVAGTGAIISNAKRRAESQARLGREQSAEAQKATNKQISDLENQQALDASGKEEAAVRTTAREKQRRKIASAQGRRSTILTSPLGVSNIGSGAVKKELTGT